VSFFKLLQLFYARMLAISINEPEKDMGHFQMICLSSDHINTKSQISKKR